MGVAAASKHCFPAQLLWRPQAEGFALASLPDKLIRTPDTPLSVFLPWNATPLSTLPQGIGCRAAREKLEACCRFSNCELHIYMFKTPPAAQVQSPIAKDITGFMEGGVHAVTVEWHTPAAMTGAHLTAIGQLVGRYVTHLTLHTSLTIPDDGWSGLWAAFPNLQHLTLKATNIGSSTAVCEFCAAAPHGLEVTLLPVAYLRAGAWLDSGLHTTRVLITSTILGSN
jgi:hypothetical protein